MDTIKGDSNGIIVKSNGHLPVKQAGYVNGGYADYVPEVIEDDTSSGLIEYWQMIQRRKGTVVLLAFAGLLLAVLVTLPQTPVFQARASLEVQNMNEDFLNMKEVNPVSDSTGYNALTDMQTQIRLLQSESLLERVIAKLKAEDAVVKVPESRFMAWRRALNLQGPPSRDPAGDMLRSVGENVKIRAAGQTRLVEIMVDSTDPALAARFANTLANEFIDANIEARWQMSQRTGAWLGKQLDEMKVKLERSEDQLQTYAREAGLVFMSDEKGNNTGNVSQDKLRQVQVELSRAQAERMAWQSRREMAMNTTPEALPDALSNSSLREYQTRLTDLQRAEADLTETYKPEVPKVKRIQAQIKTVEAALERERKAVLERIENGFIEATRREKLLDTDYSRQTRTVTSDAERSIQYNIFKREVDSNRQIYEAMLQRVKESSIASAMRASNVRVVDTAGPPPHPYKPRLPLNAALGLFLGSLAGVAFVIMRERADRTLQQPGDAPFYLNVPELGVIPSSESGKKRIYYLRRKKGEESSADAQQNSLMLGLSKTKEGNIEVATYVNKSSALAESFRATLTSILFSGQNGTRPRMLVITSANPGEGKSTVTSNLAVAIAEIGHRVLLIDADLRKPKIHKVFGLENNRGLSDLLRERRITEGAAEEMIQDTAVAGLRILTSGPSTAAAANLLHSANLAPMLKRFRADYDMVLIDTPPMLQMPDARVAGRIADAVILVIRADRTTRDAAVAMRQRLNEDSIRILGTILNDWNAAGSMGAYSRYGYGAYGEYYGNQEEHSKTSQPA